MNYLEFCSSRWEKCFRIKKKRCVWFFTQMFKLRAHHRVLAQHVRGILQRDLILTIWNTKNHTWWSPHYIFSSWSPPQLLKGERPKARRALRAESRAMSYVTGVGVWPSCFRSPSMPEPPYVKLPLVSLFPYIHGPNVCLYLTVSGSSPKSFFFIIFCFLVVLYVLVTTKLRFTFKWNKYGH